VRGLKKKKGGGEENESGGGGRGGGGGGGWEQHVLISPHASVTVVFSVYNMVESEFRLNL